jgi:hypothetical protein
MAENLNQIMWGEGVAFIGGKEAFEIQELALQFGLETITGRKGDSGGNIVEITGQPITGRVGFLGFNAALMATLTGGASATGTVKRIREESLTVATNAVTASQTPIANTMRVVESGSNNIPLLQVVTPAAAGEYSITGTTIAFFAGAYGDGTVMKVSYFYTDGADGETLTIDPTDLPDSFELYASIRTREKFGGTKGDAIIYAAKCKRTGEFAFGSGIGDFTSFGFDINIEIDNGGDLLVYFP